jgi:chromosome segregation ATPase
MTQVHPSESNPVPGAIRWGLVWLAVFLAPGCATTKDLDTLQAQLNDQVTAVRNDVAQSRQAVDVLKTDVTLIKSIGIAVDSLKSRFDAVQAALQGVAKETDRLRMNVGSLEQGMMHQLQMEVTLARERVKQLEQIIESLQKNNPAEKDKEGAATPKL